MKSQRDPIWAIWKSFSVAAKPLNPKYSQQWVGWQWGWGSGVFRGSAATLNDFQMAQMGSRCDCMIKSYPKKIGREIPENLRRPIVNTKMV